ncbi:hypothetical protein CEUSTIGMA_g10413.t1 [Chlamydomonas eustigma]|uniref:Uncharacterized protein n=1 Tax=Chlamydomonas eustigma TaxID=1157962 RepID=A0A250XIZ1_9CHLO|nr:hypothetical protein CEUSTIGMA_g10413.t1 [Chlamydomonas eustigma]|eukprot:GAX82986.1 hypothetical protein CEUSTIGMA_g10413.t1 [Chlamydomonas eustigma]
MQELICSKLTEVADVVYLTPTQHLLTQSEDTVFTSDGASILHYQVASDPLNPDIDLFHVSSSFTNQANILTADWPKQVPEASPPSVSISASIPSKPGLDRGNRNTSSTNASQSIHIMTASPRIPTDTVLIPSSHPSHSHHASSHSTLLAVAAGSILRIFPIKQSIYSSEANRTLVPLQPQSSLQHVAKFPALPLAASHISISDDGDESGSSSSCELKTPVSSQRWLALSWHPHFPGILAAATQGHICICLCTCSTEQSPASGVQSGVKQSMPPKPLSTSCHMSVLALMPSGLPETITKSTASLVWLRSSSDSQLMTSAEAQTCGTVSSMQATLVASWGSYVMLYEWSGTALMGVPQPGSINPDYSSSPWSNSNCTSRPLHLQGLAGPPRALMAGPQGTLLCTTDAPLLLNATAQHIEPAATAVAQPAGHSKILIIEKQPVDKTVVTTSHHDTTPFKHEDTTYNNPYTKHDPSSQYQSSPEALHSVGRHHSVSVKIAERPDLIEEVMSTSYPVGMSHDVHCDEAQQSVQSVKVQENHDHFVLARDHKKSSSEPKGLERDILDLRGKLQQHSGENGGLLSYLMGDLRFSSDMGTGSQEGGLHALNHESDERPTLPPTSLEASTSSSLVSEEAPLARQILIEPQSPIIPPGFLLPTSTRQATAQLHIFSSFLQTPKGPTDMEALSSSLNRSMAVAATPSATIALSSVVRPDLLDCRGDLVLVGSTSGSAAVHVYRITWPSAPLELLSKSQPHNSSNCQLVTKAEGAFALQHIGSKNLCIPQPPRNASPHLYRLRGLQLWRAAPSLGGTSTINLQTGPASSSSLSSSTLLPASLLKNPDGVGAIATGEPSLLSLVALLGVAEDRAQDKSPLPLFMSVHKTSPSVPLGTTKLAPLMLCTFPLQTNQHSTTDAAASNTIIQKAWPARSMALAGQHNATRHLPDQPHSTEGTKGNSSQGTGMGAQEPAGHETVTLEAVLEMMRGMEERLNRNNNVLEVLLSRVEALEEKVQQAQHKMDYSL